MILAELVRADEAQKTAEWLVAEAEAKRTRAWSTVNALMGAIRDRGLYASFGYEYTAWDKCEAHITPRRDGADHWRSECEKAQTERDELRVEVAKLYVDRDQARAEMDAAVEERDQLRADRDSEHASLQAVRHDLSRWTIECTEARVERDKYMADLICAKADADYLIEQRELAEDRVTALTAECDELREKLAGTIDDGRHGFCETCGEERVGVRFCRVCGDCVNDELGTRPLPEPDANNPAHLRFAARIVHIHADYTRGFRDGSAADVPSLLNEQADRLEAEQQVSRREQAIEKLAEIIAANDYPDAPWPDDYTDVDQSVYRARARALVDAFPGIIDAVLGGE